MADQSRTSLPYGDIFSTATPAIDRVAQQLYVQQQYRQAQQSRENQALDAQMQKEFANIRSVDTPEVVSTYNELKNAKKQLYFNKDLQRNPLMYNQAQQYANEAQAKLNTLINQSREIKDMQAEMIKDHFKNPDAYSDDFGVRTNTLMNTPISKLQNHPQFGDLTNWDNYRYQGSNTNFNEDVSKAYGQPKKILGKEEPLDKQGIQFRTPEYEYGNGPRQVFEGIVNSMDHKKERDAAYKWKQLTPDIINKIETDYAAIPQSSWEQRGLSGPQPIELHSGSDAEKYARVLAMQHAVNTQPRLSGYQNRTSELNKLNLEWGQQKAMENIRFGHQKELKKSDQDAANSWVDNYWTTRINNARAGQPTPFWAPEAPLTVKMGYEIPMDAVVAKAFERNGQQPNQMFVTTDNKIFPVFYKYKEDYDDKGKKIGVSVARDENGNPKVDWDYSQPVELDQAYLNMGYKGQTKKGLGGTMSEAYKGTPTANKHPLPAGKPRTVKQGGYTYEWDSETGTYK